MKKLLMTLVLLLGGICTTYAQSGYRGFADISLGASILDSTGFAAALSTTHGYQCNGHIFVGAGVEVGYSGAEYWGYYWDEVVGCCLPLYLQLRYDYSLVSTHSFYGAFRVGYDVLTNMPYYAPEFGVRFGKIGPVSFNLGFRIEVDGYYDEDAKVGVSPSVAFGIEF